MGGKSRKAGSVSKKLIERLKSGSGRNVTNNTTPVSRPSVPPTRGSGKA